MRTDSSPLEPTMSSLFQSEDSPLEGSSIGASGTGSTSGTGGTGGTGGTSGTMKAECSDARPLLGEGSLDNGVDNNKLPCKVSGL